MNLIEKLEELNRKEPEKSLIAFGLEDRDGEPTQRGIALLVRHLWNANRKDIYDTYVRPVAEAEKNGEK